MNLLTLDLFMVKLFILNHTDPLITCFSKRFVLGNVRHEMFERYFKIKLVASLLYIP